MTTQRLHAILREHGVHPKFRAEFCDLVQNGTRPGQELLTRLNCVMNFKAALKEAMTELTQAVPHKLPPVRYKYRVSSKDALAWVDLLISSVVKFVLAT